MFNILDAVGDWRHQRCCGDSHHRASGIWRQETGLEGGGVAALPQGQSPAGVLGQLLHVAGGSWEDAVTGEVLLWDSISELWQGTEGALVEPIKLFRV